MSNNELPSALDSCKEIAARLQDRRAAVFLDYDGTLTPIVSRPEDAVLPDSMRTTIQNLAAICTVAVISGRDLIDVRRLVDIDGICYAGSHGFDIAGPAGKRLAFQKGTEFLPALDRIEDKLSRALAGIAGVWTERKKFSVAVHFRRVEAEKEWEVRRVVESLKDHYPDLRLSHGKKIHEFHPGVDWNKGKALLWILERLQMNGSDVLPFYIGDDTTDEDAFKVLEGRGIGIVVCERSRPSAAQYKLKSPREVKEFLDMFIAVLQR